MALLNQGDDGPHKNWLGGPHCVWYRVSYPMC